MTRRKPLSEYANYVKEKIDASLINADNYISTDNMIANRGGICRSEYVPTEGRVTRFVKGDILISNIRPYFKKIWKATFDGGCCADVLVIRSKGFISNSYLYYVLSQDSFFDYVMTAHKGSKMPRGDKDHIMRYPVTILGDNSRALLENRYLALDEIIENNKSIIDSLTNTIQDLFNYWFVQFDFPDKSGKPYRSSGGEMVENSTLKTLIPKEWECVQLGSIAKMLTTTINPEKSKEYKHYSIPAYDETGIPKIESGTEIDSGKYAVPSNCILVSKLNPQFKRLWLVKESDDMSICSTEFLPFVSKDMNYEYLFGLLNSEGFYRYMVQCSSSSTGSRKRMQPELCLLFYLPYPKDTSILKRFCELLSGYVEMIITLKNENQELISLRNYSIPLILNGQAILTGKTE